jgi:Protein of unknown function (DUF3307)
MHLLTQTIDELTMNILVMARSFDPTTLSRAVVFVVAFVVLLVSHQLGDHVLQTDHQAAGKAGTGWAARWAMLGHLTGYHAGALLLLSATFAVLGLPLTVLGAGAGLTFSAVTHAALDRRWPVLAILRALRSPRFAETTTPVSGAYAADQALHQGALLISALLVAAL